MLIFKICQNYALLQMAACVGMAVVSAMKPGGHDKNMSICAGTKDLSKISNNIEENNITLANPALDLIHNLFPTNIILASLTQTQSRFVSSMY